MSASEYRPTWDVLEGTCPRHESPHVFGRVSVSEDSEVVPSYPYPGPRLMPAW